MHSVAFVVLIFWIIQIISGIFLLGVIAYVLDTQFNDLLEICLHGNYIWFVKIFHMLCSNFAMLLLIVHIIKSISFLKIISFEKFILWCFGFILFLIALGVSFSGYVLVSGNMSFELL